jgi:RND family efflux transporter MFP subunit
MRAAGLCLLLAAGSLPAAAQPGAEPAAAPIAITAEQRAALGIAVAAVERETGSAGAARPAQVVVPNEQLRVVSARIAGVVESLHAAVGDEVQAGDPLATLRSAALVALASEFLQASAQHELARATASREGQLASEGIVAQRRAQESQAALSAAAAVLRERRQALLLAGLSLEEVDALARSREPLDHVTLRAPLDGAVLEQSVTVGQRVEPDQALYHIARLQPLWLEVHVPLDEARALAAGAPVTVLDPPVRGRVVAVGRDVHPVDQGVLVRAEVDVGAEQLRPGQFVQARLPAAGDGGAGEAFRVPRAALARAGERTVVFAESEAGFVPRAVRVVADAGEHVVVAGELAAGDRVVVSGTAALKSAWLGGAAGHP